MFSFDGQCEAAFKFYEESLGGKIQSMMTYEGTPAANQVPADWRKKVIHATINIGSALVMGSKEPQRRRFTLFLEAVAANQLIHGINEGVEFIFGGGLDFAEFLKAGCHPLGEDNFGLGQAADQVRESGDGRFELGKTLLVPLGRRFEPGLRAENKFHGLLNVHEA